VNRPSAIAQRRDCDPPAKMALTLMSSNPYLTLLLKWMTLPRPLKVTKS
jgi:hypothetical protein